MSLRLKGLSYSLNEKHQFAYPHFAATVSTSAGSMLFGRASNKTFNLSACST